MEYHELSLKVDGLTLYQKDKIIREWLRKKVTELKANCIHQQNHEIESILGLTLPPIEERVEEMIKKNAEYNTPCHPMANIHGAINNAKDLAKLAVDLCRKEFDEIKRD